MFGFNRTTRPTREEMEERHPYSTCDEPGCSVVIDRRKAKRVLFTVDPPVSYPRPGFKFYCPAHAKPYERVEVGSDYKWRYLRQVECSADGIPRVDDLNKWCEQRADALQEGELLPPVPVKTLQAYGISVRQFFSRLDKGYVELMPWKHLQTSIHIPFCWNDEVKKTYEGLRGAYKAPVKDYPKKSRRAKKGGKK